MTIRMAFCDPDSTAVCGACGAPLSSQQVVADGDLFPDDIFCDRVCLREAVLAAEDEWDQ